MAPDPAVRTIAARVHGRYVLRTPDAPRPWPIVLGFHGYAEDAERHLSVLERIPGAGNWLLVAVQALHPFYTRDDRIVANWMTRQDRELAIDDNLRYVAAVMEAVRREHVTDGPVVVAGFSQGGAMAYRAAPRVGAAGAIALAADVPPEIEGHHALPPVLLGRGTEDAWYTEEKMASDLARLADLTSSVYTCVFEGGHEWTDAFAAAAGAFLDRIRRVPPSR